jgi:hypothetical protein
LASELNIQQQQAIAMANARKRQAQVPAQESMNEGLRTAGRFGRNLAGGVASAADMALLVPKTAALGLSALTGNEKLKQIGQTPSLHDQALGFIDEKTSGKLQPRGMMEKGVDLASELMTPVGMLGAGKKTISGMEAILNPASAVSKVAKQAMPTNEITQGAIQKMDSEQLRKAASGIYDQAEKKGGVLKPEFTNQFLDDLQDIVPQTKAGKLFSGENEVSGLLKRAQALRDSPVSLREVQEMDEELGALIESNMDMGKPTKIGRSFLEIQSRLRDAVQNASPENVVGSKEGFDLLKRGRDLWSRQARLRDVERIITRAEYTENPSTALRTGFKNLLTNPKKLRGYSKQEQEAIKKAASGGPMRDILKTFGSRLVTIGAAVTGGPVGAAVGYAAPAVSRSLVDSMAFNKANKVTDLISQSTKQPAPVGMNTILRTNALNNLLARGQ